MASVTELRETYSFIRSLQSDSCLKRYGDNSLPLYAIALYLDIEDLDSFATDSLPDHSSDKKADIIYISEADGVACVAQGYTGKIWGKQSAPANKASDLNTAVCVAFTNSDRESPRINQGTGKTPEGRSLEEEHNNANLCIRP